MDFVDDFVSSDLVYDLGGDLQKAVLVLQEDLARFNPSHPDMPHPGFLSAKQVSKSIRLFLNE